MKRSDAFPTKYISKDDLQSGPIRAVIADVVKETMPGDEGEDASVMYFAGECKPMILNVSNWMVCEDAYGPDSDEWKGRAVELYWDTAIMYAGKRVGGKRIRIPAAAPTNPGIGRTPDGHATNGPAITVDQKKKIVSLYASIHGGHNGENGPAIKKEFASLHGHEIETATATEAENYISYLEAQTSPF